MKSTFLTAISHELRTPVQVIVGAASTLLNADRLELSPEDRMRFTSSIDTKGRRLASLLRDVVDVDRLNRGVVRFDRRVTRLDELIEAVVADVDILADHALHIEIDAVSAPVDPALIERVLENLLANAARHTPAGTEVWVRLRAEPGGVLIVVEDAGPGVAVDKRELIFTPFGQGQIQAHAPGLGVGLSLVARFVDLHGGRVWVEDRPGGGASFRVLLPIDPPTDLLDRA
jgi:two-component system sensor histidine kinase KdpD